MRVPSFSLLIIYCLLGLPLSGQVFQAADNTGPDAHTTKVIPLASGYLTIGYSGDLDDQVRARLLLYDGFNTVQWATELDTTTIFQDGIYVEEEDAILLVGYRYLGVLPDQNRVGLISAFSSIDGSLLFSKVVEPGRTGTLRKIIQHPNPAAAAPFFATGTFRNGDGFALDDLLLLNFDLLGNFNFVKRVRYVSDDSPDLQAGNDLCLLPNGNMIASGGEGPVSTNLIEFDINGEVVTSGFANVGHLRGLQPDFQGGTVFTSANFQGLNSYLGIYNDLYELQFRLNLPDVDQVFLMDTEPSKALVSGFRRSSPDSSELVVMEFSFSAMDASLNWAKSYELFSGESGFVTDLEYIDDGRIAYSFIINTPNGNGTTRSGHFGMADEEFNACGFDSTMIVTQVSSSTTGLGTLDFLTLDADFTESSTGSNSAMAVITHICGDGRPTNACFANACSATSVLNLSTGIDTTGNLLAVGVIDPYWTLMNIPPLDSPLPSGVAIPDMYTILPFSNSTAWNVINDPAYPANRPLNVRPNAAFGADNLFQSQPWRIRRQFCVCETSTVVIDGLTSADNTGRLFLYGEIDPVNPIANLGETVQVNVTAAFNQDWPIGDTLTLLPGTYHLEYELRNLSAQAMGFALAGTIEVISGDQTLFNSEASCCGAGVISVQKILDEDCDGLRDNGEPGLANWNFTLTDNATGQTIAATTDPFGEIIFRALPYGTYTLTEAVTYPFVPTNPTSGSTTITIDDNNPIVATTFLNKNVEECNCAESGLVLENSSEEACCFDLSLTSQNIDVSYVEIAVTQGALFDPNSVVLGSGLSAYGNSPNSRLIGATNGGPLPATIPDLIEFCLTEVIVAPQLLSIHYLNADLEEVCVDMLATSCPVSNPCLDLVEADLDCHSAGYELNLHLVNPPGGGFDSIGFVQLSITSPLSLGETFEYSFDPAIGETETINLNEILTSNSDLFGEDLCIVISAHDDEAQRLCCFVDSLCIPFPLCDPCPFVDAEAIVNPEDSCCYTLTIDNSVPVAGYFDSLYVEVSNGPHPTLLSSNPLSNSAWTGSEVLPNQSFSYVPSGGATTPLFDLPILDFCVTPDFSPDSTFLTVYFFNTEEDTVCIDSVAAICLLDDPCPDLETFLVQQAEDSCCYDLFYSNSFTADSTLLEAIRVQWIDGPGSGFTSYTAVPIPGWNPTSIQEPNVNFLFTHPSGSIPITSGIRLMEFCVEESFSVDSTLVEVSFQTESDTICQDTLSAFCPGCLTIDDEVLACTDDGDYLYLFSFTNYSDFPVNRVVLLQSDGHTGLNTESIIDLGFFVPVGGSFTSSIPVSLSGSAGEEVCFDIVLRHLLPNQQINIECCYLTQCITLPDCEDTRVIACPAANVEWTDNCPTDEIQEVCGCDGEIYANPCLALQNGVLDFSLSLSDCGNILRTEIDLSGSLVENSWADLSWSSTSAGLNPVLEVLRFRFFGEEEWQELDRWEISSAFRSTYRPMMTVGQAVEFQLLSINQLGQVAFSNTVLLTPALEDATISLILHPNPVTTEVRLVSNRPGQAELEIIDLNGRISYLQRVGFGDNPLPVNVSDLIPGVYSLRVRYSDGAQGLVRFVKE